MGLLGAIWGLLGVTALLGSAVARLAPKAIEALAMPLSTAQRIALAAWVLFMAFAEGYRGFQQGFSPRVAARARYLNEHPSGLRVALAPFFCMGYFGAPRRRRMVAIGLTSGVVLLVALVRFLAQPWRGIVDAGVVVGLAWGLVTLLWYAVRAFVGRGISVDPEVAHIPPSGR